MDSLIILDQKGVIHWASSTVFGMLGYLPEELHGTQIFNLLSPAFGKTEQLYGKMQENPSKINEGLRQFLAKTGQYVPLYITINSLPEKSLTELILLHLHLFKPNGSERFSISKEKAEIEIAIHKKKEHEIAADLHDHINPTLVGAKLLLDYALQDPLQHSIHLKKASLIINDLIREIRDLSHTINENADRDFKLSEGLHSILENFQKGSSLRIVFRYDHRLESILSSKQKVHLVRIIQEQLVNITKHAAAGKVLISLQQVGEKIRLVTKDNGKGFDPANYHHGIGIKNMLSRVNELKGNMHINSKCGEGTSIRIILPMKNTTTSELS